MSATNSTPIINLPLFIGTDKPAWLTDWNGAMNIIDSSIAALQTAESGTATSLASLAQSVEALSGTVSQHTTAIQTVTTATATNTGSINTITSLIGNGEPTTEDKTIIGAINEIYAEIGGGTGVDAEDVTYSNTSSGLTATNVQAAIDEVASAIDDVESAIPANPSDISVTGAGTLHVYGHVCVLDIDGVFSGSQGVEISIGTLAENYRPSSNVKAPAAIGLSGSIGGVIGAKTDGTIYVIGSTALSQSEAFGQLTWFI